MRKVLALLVALAGAALLVAAGLASGQQAGVPSIISRNTFDYMLSNRSQTGCQGGAFYTYDAFLEAANATKFRGFGTMGDEAGARRLLRHHGTRILLKSYRRVRVCRGYVPVGYCLVKEPNPTIARYYGRGPIQLTNDYSYRQAGDALGLDLLGNPDLVSTDPVVAFKTAIWFWMTPQPWKPSCHDVMTDGWTPSAHDRDAQMFPGYGMTTYIINGTTECGKGNGTPGAKDRVRYYKKYCGILQVGWMIEEIAQFKKGFLLSIVDNVIVKVEHWKPSASARMVLPKAWFHIRRIPSNYRNKDNVAYVGSLVRLTQMVDEDTIDKFDYVRANIMVMDVERVPAVSQGFLDNIKLSSDSQHSPMEMDIGSLSDDEEDFDEQIKRVSGWS
ncbi:hypothetical protein ACQ4PT_011656 [Festuca glaucescens]